MMRFLRLILVVFISFNCLKAQHSDIFSAAQFSKGIYFTYSDFKSNTPDTLVDFTIETSKKRSHSLLNNGFFNQLREEDTVQLVFYLRNKKGKLINRVYGFSDGKALYINSALYQNHSDYYLRVLEVGKIMLFKDPIMNMAESVNNTVLLGALGLLASLANNADTIVLFYQDEGVPYLLSERTLKAILKQGDQDLYSKFMSIEKANRNSVLEKFVMEFNNRHR